jgi:hypothetical protein
MQRDALDLDMTIPRQGTSVVGPFARVRADEVVRSLGKTRGAINNVWKSQESFQAAVMAFSLSASAEDGLGVGGAEYRAPASFEDVDEWIGALAASELERGPHHGMEPRACYALRWAAWLGLAPYAIWSEAIATQSLTEYRLGVENYSKLLTPALEHFGLELTNGVTLADFAVAIASTVEGFWLNACCSESDPAGRAQQLDRSLATTLLLILRGATRPASRPSRVQAMRGGSGDADMPAGPAADQFVQALAPSFREQRNDVTTPAAGWAEQATRLQTRFENVGNTTDLDDAIECGNRAIEATNQNSLEMRLLLDAQARRLKARYDVSMRHADLDASIELGMKALELLPSEAAIAVHTAYGSSGGPELDVEDSVVGLRESDVGSLDRSDPEADG